MSKVIEHQFTGQGMEAGAEIAGGIALMMVPGGQMMGAMLLSSGIASEAGAIAQALGSKTGLGITTRTPACLRQIIRGEQRVGGNIVYCSTTGSTNRQYNLVIVLATHPCEAIVNLYLDGRQVYWESSNYNQTVNGYNFGGNADNNNHEGPNGVQYNFGGLVFCAAFQGKQTADPTIVSGAWVGPSVITDATASYPGYCGALLANDPNWAPNSQGTPYLAGCTWVYLKIEYDSGTFPQFPEIRFTVMGKNDIYDPRTGTRGYSSNWALNVADAITDPTWGLGDPSVNQDQLIAAANVCDELVATAAAVTTWEPNTNYFAGQVFNAPDGNTYTVTTNYVSGAAWGDDDSANVEETPGATVMESRYCLHWHYDTGTAPGEAIDHMVTSKLGRLSRIGGEWYIWPAYWQGPSFTFDENSLLDAIQWTSKRSLGELVNRVTGTYIAANYPYNIAGNLYDSNGFFNGQTQNNFPFAFQPTNFPMYAADPLHGYGEDVYLIADTPNQGAWSATATYPVGAVVQYTNGQYSLWQALQAVPAGTTPGTGSAYWAPTGNYLPLELNLDTTLSESEAQRLAKIAMMRNRQQGAGTLVMSFAAFQAQAIDVIQFNSPKMSWTDKLLEIAGNPGQEMKLHFAPPPKAAAGERGDQDDTPALWLEVPVNETDPSVYEWETSEELTPYDVPALSGQVNMWQVAPPTGVTAVSDLATALVQSDGTVSPQIEVSWTEPADTYVTNGGSIEIQICAHSSAAWQDAALVGGQTTQLFIRVTSGSVYDIRVRAIRSNGAMSAWVELDGIVAGFALSSSDLNPVAPAGTVTAVTVSSTDSMIVVNPFTATLGGFTASCLPAGAVTLDGYTPQTLYYVYYVDPNFAGGAITPVVTVNVSDFLNKPGYFLIGSVITPPYLAGGGGAGSTQYSPSAWSNLGSTAITNPTAAYDHNTSTPATVVAQEVTNPTTHVSTPYSGSCKWSGFPAGALSYAATLTVNVGTSGAGTWSISSSLGTIASGSGAATQQNYTIAVPSGTDLSTVTVTVDATAPAGETVSVYEIWIQ